MPTDIAIGQKWSAWVGGRQQWLLATVVAVGKGNATLEYDPAYELQKADNKIEVDVSTLLSSRGQFRFVR